ncbi:hypothetical protein HPB48_022342 [Haemaphysalis longicornis]|uniref:Cullin N-terminal domain-containing protein n=1 Tax=Haemaphysalis longicornis TaxID=44386 RepID=A0A9J6FXZ6_HAELO|nr:hypothetical protein HPB48_022342 [Haemaphysalis longicornis]
MDLLSCERSSRTTSVLKVSRPLNRLGEAGCQDPKLYVEAILGVYRKYNTVVLTAFAKDKGFLEFLDKACTKFINENAATLLAKSSRKSPELLARYFRYDAEGKLCKPTKEYSWMTSLTSW